MLKIAVTGNIASGKSVFENLLKEKGYKVFDTDEIAHEVLETSEEVKEAFKTYDIITNGKIDREKLAKVVFSDKNELNKLESLIHPLVKKEILEIFKNDCDIVFISVPQLFEAKFEDLFDKIILITADRETRLERLIKRNNYTLEEAQKRINAQINEAEKIGKCDYILENNGTLDDLKKAAENIISNLSK